MEVVAPAFFDLQVNGFGGVDFNGPGLSAAAVEEALARMQATGVTRCLPTLITSSLDDFRARAEVFAALDHPAVAGLHMEGPYLSPVDGPRGAHPAAHIRPADIDDFRRRQDAAHGRIRLVTLAPEVPGALPLIEYLVSSGVRVAIGHTAASPDRIAAAITAGATLATHLGNGCAATLPRHPNVIWELAAADDVLASIIVDGHHLPPSVVKTVVRAKGLSRTVLVTDAMAAAGALPGRYRMGGVEAEATADGRVSLPGTPYLAGSSLTMDRAVALTASMTRLALDDVLPMASTIPAAYLGEAPRGTLRLSWMPATASLKVLSVDL